MAEEAIENKDKSPSSNSGHSNDKLINCGAKNKITGIKDRHINNTQQTQTPMQGQEQQHSSTDSFGFRTHSSGASLKITNKTISKHKRKCFVDEMESFPQATYYLSKTDQRPKVYINNINETNKNAENQTKTHGF